MKTAFLTLIAAVVLASINQGSATAADGPSTSSSAEILARIKSSSNVAPAAKWPREGVADEDFLKLPYEQRLNQLVLDDNLRTLHLLVRSDFSRNTPSFKRIESFVAQLSNRNLSSKLRWEAAKSLGDEKHVVAVYGLPSLIQAFHGDPDITVRNYAALALIKIDVKSAVPQLIHGLDSSDPDSRQLSASAFHSADASAVPFLVKLIKCDDPHLKNLGCLALAEVGAPANNALNALRGASTELDEKGAYSQVAAASMDRILNESRSIQASSVEIPFDENKWKATEQKMFRPAMAKYILSSGLLIGKDLAEVVNLLGRGVTANGGEQLRYDIGMVPANFITHAKKKHSPSAGPKNVEPADAWLVVILHEGVVSDCELKTFNQSDWSVVGVAQPAISPHAANDAIPPLLRISSGQI